MRILALDVGEKRIGLAMSDELGWTAQGLPTLERQSSDQDLSAIVQLAKEHKVTEIVVGMPVNMNGTLGKKAEEVTEFLQDLKQKTDIPIKVWDERLTSLQAERIMIAANVSRKKRKQKSDKLAAQLILQGYLDSKTGSSDV